MGHIKEPNGVDFVINSRHLTKEEEIAISEYICAYKAKHVHNLSGKSRKQIASKRGEQHGSAKRGATSRKKVNA